MSPTKARYINTPGTIGITLGIESTWLGACTQCTAFTATKLTKALPANEPIASPMSRPILLFEGPRLTKLRVQTAMIPPMATTQSNRRGMLNIIEKPIAEMAAAIA